MVDPCDRVAAPKDRHPGVSIHPLTVLRFKLPTDLTGFALDTTLQGVTYSIDVVFKELTVNGKTYRCLDYAQSVRN